MKLLLVIILPLFLFACALDKSPTNHLKIKASTYIDEQTQQQFDDADSNIVYMKPVGLRADTSSGFGKSHDAILDVIFVGKNYAASSAARRFNVRLGSESHPDLVEIVVGDMPILVKYPPSDNRQRSMDIIIDPKDIGFYWITKSGGEMAERKPLEYVILVESFPVSLQPRLELDTECRLRIKDFSWGRLAGNIEFLY